MFSWWGKPSVYGLTWWWWPNRLRATPVSTRILLIYCYHFLHTACYSSRGGVTSMHWQIIHAAWHAGLTGLDDVITEASTKQTCKSLSLAALLNLSPNCHIKLLSKIWPRGELRSKGSGDHLQSWFQSCSTASGLFLRAEINEGCNAKTQTNPKKWMHVVFEVLTV